MSGGGGAARTEAAEDLVGVPDGFERLWPHRMAYAQGERPSRDVGRVCPFCDAPGKDDADGLIVHRDRRHVVLDLLPDNPVHLLVCPYRQVPLDVDLTPEETVEFTALTKARSGPCRPPAAPAGSTSA